MGGRGGKSIVTRGHSMSKGPGAGLTWLAGDAVSRPTGLEQRRKMGRWYGTGMY